MDLPPFWWCFLLVQFIGERRIYDYNWKDDPSTFTFGVKTQSDGFDVSKNLKWEVVSDENNSPKGRIVGYG
jgi:hypothetical protein